MTLIATWVQIGRGISGFFWYVHSIYMYALPWTMWCFGGICGAFSTLYMHLARHKRSSDLFTHTRKTSDIIEVLELRIWNVGEYERFFWVITQVQYTNNLLYLCWYGIMMIISFMLVINIMMYYKQRMSQMQVHSFCLMIKIFVVNKRCVQKLPNTTSFHHQGNTFHWLCPPRLGDSHQPYPLTRTLIACELHCRIMTWRVQIIQNLYAVVTNANHYQKKRYGPTLAQTLIKSFECETASTATDCVNAL